MAHIYIRYLNLLHVFVLKKNVIYKVIRKIKTKIERRLESASYVIPAINPYLSRLVGKPTMWFLKRPDTNRAVQAQKTARSMKFRI